MSLIGLDLPVAPTADSDWLLVEEGFELAREHEVESTLPRRTAM